MAEIIPAILPKSYEELAEKLDIVAAHASQVQIDICDGAYTGSRTWPYLKGVGADQLFEEISGQEKALPHWEEVDFEFDLMVKGAHEKIPDFISAGASRIVVHAGSMGREELDAVLRDYGKQSDDVGMFDVALGLALGPGDSADSIKEIADKIHFVQVMGIKNVGFQGQPFDARAIELVKALKNAYPNLPVSVDGGVDEKTAESLVKAGADRLIVGSYLFNSGDFSGTLESLGSLS